MKKKLALLLCLVLLVTALALPVSADNAAAWDGSVDTSWYSAEAKTFEISTPAQLAGLAAIVNGKADGIAQDSFSGKTIKLTAENRTDIQLRVRTTDGAALASAIFREETDRILKDGVI